MTQSQIKYVTRGLFQRNTFMLIHTTDTKSRPQRVNSYKRNLYITDTAVIWWFPNPDQVNLHRVNPVCLVWLMSYVSWYKAQSLYTKQWFSERFTKDHNRLFEGFNNYRYHKDLFYYILRCSYCTWNIAKDAFRIVFYVTTFYMQHRAVARFVLKQLFVFSWDAQCCMLLKDSVCTVN